MKYAKQHDLKGNKEYHEFLKYALNKIDLLDSYGPEIESIFTALIVQVKDLPNEPVYVELLDELLKRVISNDTKKKILARIFPTFIKISRELEIPQLREWFDLVIPHIDPIWLLEAMGRLKEAEEMIIGELEIPKNCVIAQITTKRKIYVLEIPKSRLRVKYHDVAYEDVGHPRMACILEVKEKLVTGMKLVAVPDTGDITLKTPVYRYPYSNVFENGKVCWNGYQDEEINSGRELAALPLLFLSGTNNNHLRSNVRELFDHYQGKDYSTQQLVPLGMTLKEMMN